MYTHLFKATDHIPILGRSLHSYKFMIPAFVTISYHMLKTHNAILISLVIDQVEVYILAIISHQGIL